MPKLTKRIIDAAKPKETDYFLWDDEVSGFGLRVFKSGKKSYLIQYRALGRTRRLTLGGHGTLTVDEARKLAREKLVDVLKGGNPAEEAKLDRMAPTVADLCERFMSEHVVHHCRESTQKEYRRNIDLFIVPKLGKLKTPDVSRSDVQALHEEYVKKPYQANRTLGVLSKMFNLAEVWGLRPDGSNPCRHVKKYKEEKRERYLMPGELARLAETLNRLEKEGTESQAAIDCIRLLIFTGCRLGEIQTLKWEYRIGDHLHLPDSKTGAKTVYVGKAAQDVLDGISRIRNNPYVIPGKLPGSHLSDMQKPWRRIRKEAGLDDLRIHDLRHSFASFAVGNGESLPMIGKLLGHTQVQTTARYAHLADNPMQEAADRVTDKIAEIMGRGS